MNRRNFMKSILAAGVAPYIVTHAGVLMPIKSIWVAPDEEIVIAKDLKNIWMFGEHKIAVPGDNTNWEVAEKRLMQIYKSVKK